MRRTFAGLLVALLSGLVIPLSLGQAPAHACSCAMFSLTDQANSADLVFVGTADAATVKKPEGRSVAPITFTATVDEVYAGEVGSTVELQTSTQSAACGLGQVPSGTLIWFLYLDDGTRSAGPYNVGLCSAPVPADAANRAEVAQVLGAATPVRTVAGEKPAEPNPGSTDSERSATEEKTDSDATLWWVVGAGLLALAVAGATWRLRSRRA
ncbi:hypothetical protein ACLM5J_06225 [Nocardioides sp. Bht2]|uniref:hypothetical protein n=1 Tax=Nocardioides sp. Bht2 TaxID=3392297 RepID=UPI0039B64455